MKIVRIAFVTAAVTLAACSESPVSSTLEPSFARNGAQQSVTGHFDPDLSRVGVNEQYSFSAIRHPNGTVSGRFEVHDKYTDGTMDRVTGVVTCFAILPDGKTARVGGVIESSTSAFVPPGREAVWTVRDNGEGNELDDAGTDLSWGYQPGSAQTHCDTGLRFYKQPHGFTLRGNVQVRP